MTKGQGALGEEVGVDGVVDVDHVDAVAAGADDAKAAGAGTGEHPGDEMRVTHAPDEMGAERDGAEFFGVGGEDFAFGNGLRQRIGTRASGGERERFVGPGEVAAVVDDTGRARVDQAADAVRAATLEERAGAEDIGAEKIGVAAPDADFRGSVKDGFDASAGRGDGGGVVEGGANEADPAFFEIGCRRAGEHRDRAARREEPFDEVAAEEASAAGD